MFTIAHLLYFENELNSGGKILSVCFSSSDIIFTICVLMCMVDGCMAHGRVLIIFLLFDWWLREGRTTHGSVNHQTSKETIVYMIVYCFFDLHLSWECIKACYVLFPEKWCLMLTTKTLLLSLSVLSRFVD